MPDGILCKTVACPLCGRSCHRETAGGYDYEYRTSQMRFTFVRCLGCGHEYLNPRPDEASVPLTYPADYYTLEGRHTAKKSRLIAFLKRKITGRRLAYIKERLPADARILEIGCGDCSLLAEIKNSFPEWRVSGIDLAFSDETLTFCRENDIETETGNIETIRPEQKRYDLIILNQLIEHLADPVAVIEKLSSSLKPGGFLSIETPDSKGYDRIFFHRSYWGGYYFPRHLSLFDFKHLKQILEKNGFQIESHFSLVAPIIWAFSLHAAIGDRIENEAGKKIARKIFSDKNPACLAFFTLTDLMAIRIGLRTSNQKIIARKPT